MLSVEKQTRSKYNGKHGVIDKAIRDGEISNAQ